LKLNRLGDFPNQKRSTRHLAGVFEKSKVHCGTDYLSGEGNAKCLKNAVLEKNTIRGIEAQTTTVPLRGGFGNLQREGSSFIPSSRKARLGWSLGGKWLVVGESASPGAKKKRGGGPPSREQKRLPRLGPQQKQRAEIRCPKVVDVGWGSQRLKG